MGGTTAIADTRQYLAARVRDSVGQLVDAVDGRHVYGPLAPVEIGEVARATERLADLIVTALAGDGRLHTSAARFLRRLGTRRARQGIPLDHVAAAFGRATRAGLVVMKDAAVEWPDPPAAWDTYAVMAAELSELVHAALGYVRDGYEEWDTGSGDGTRPNPVGVEDVFEGAWASAEEVVDHCRDLGYALTRDAVLVTSLALDPKDTERLQSFLAEIPDTPAREVVVGRPRSTPVPHVPAVVALRGGDDAGAVDQRLAIWARRHHAVVVVERLEDVTHVPARYRAVRDDLALVAATARTPGIVDRTRDLRVPRVLSVIEPEHAQPFVRTTLGGVLARPPASAEPLLDTLHVLFSSTGRIEQVAALLSLSLSGLRTRLQRVEELTGRHHSRDRVELLLALLLFRIHRLHLPAVGDARWRP